MGGQANGTAGIACIVLPQPAATGSPATSLQKFDLDDERQAASIVYTTEGRTVRVTIDRNDVSWSVEG